MKLALLTQRVDVDPNYGERRDALDQRWAEFALAAGFVACAAPNRSELNASFLLERVAPDVIVFTGGNSISFGGKDVPNAAPERDSFEFQLLEAAVRTGIPVKGVCRGMQLVNLWYDGGLRDLPGHVAVRHALRGQGPAEVNSYHASGILEEDLAMELEATAWAPDGSVEAFRGRDANIQGIMWHPEREHQFNALDLQWMADI